MVALKEPLISNSKIELCSPYLLATVQEKKENQDDRNAKQNVLDLYKKRFSSIE